MKRLSTAVLLSIAVFSGGCVAVPAGPGYYPSDGYYPPAPAYSAPAPVYYPAPAYYAYAPPAYYGPSVSLGIFGGGRWGGYRGGYRGGRGYRR